MKGYEEIRRILTEDFGFVDLAAYKRWIADVRPNIALTVDLLQKLSPDSVDCRAFWKVCDDLFGHDPICNVASPPKVGTLPGQRGGGQVNPRPACRGSGSAAA